MVYRFNDWDRLTENTNKENEMKTYYIYDFQTDEELCEIRAWSIVDAEVRACVLLNRGSGEVVAFTERQ